MRRAGSGLAVMVATMIAFSVFAACSGSSSDTVGVERTGAITWRPCRSAGMQCASLDVPLDHDAPHGDRITLSLARRPASGKSQGVLLTNPGGPGASGVSFLDAAEGFFGPEVLSNFDLVSWDPRGVGDSEPVRCLDDLDSFYAVDRTPDDSADVNRNVEAAKEFASACERNSGRVLEHLATDASVRDMEAIRAAMAVDTIDYVGFSYGTLLGARYAERYPQHTGQFVLDGAIDPSLTSDEAAIAQAKGFESLLDEFFAWCTRDTDCGFARGGDVAAAFDSLAAAVAAEPTPAKVEGERRTLGPGEFTIGVASALYLGEPGFEALGKALAETARGSGDSLLALADAYTEREAGGKYSNLTAAFYATSCVDEPAPRTVAAVRRLARRVEKVAPRMGEAAIWLGLPCTYWPARAARESAPVRAPDAPPILVVGTTNDPATPYAAAQALTEQLGNARLLTLEDDGHLAYARGNECIDDAVERYLREGELPPENTRCS
jgi:pimeloyl-ACP methyl ester carboxylesterase